MNGQKIIKKKENNMDWTQVLTLFFANAGLIIWFRSESRSDWRHMDAKLDANLKGIQDEMKEFHTKLALQDQEFKMRLCAIEERKIGKKL